MKLSTWDRVQQLFLAAADLGREQQARFLDSIDDPALRIEVEEMLRADSESAATISSAIEDEAALLLESRTAAGDRLGPYRLLNEIGRGGMGAVFLASRDDDQFEKKVAIKIVKPGMDTAEVLGRFRYERQILANLDHPYIAKLLDGGTTREGRPFFVMDYVEGRPVDAFCQERGLSVRERCLLFLRIAEAIAHAHRNLIIHRDLKPANIFVTADGTPKLLDFGVAKLISPDAAPALTATAAHRPLTPEYASPEQILGLPVTTTTDIYSLGAILYELLTGKRAHATTTGSRHELERVICENNLARPSTVRRGLDSDLDNIVLMAMRKEPERRYQSVDQFADDLRRYLEGRPVQARQNSFLYRATKFVRRNRFQLAAAALILASLVIGLIAAISKSHEAEQARRIAVYERARAEAESREAKQAREDEARERVIANQQRDEAVRARELAEKRLTQLFELADKSLFDIHNAIQHLPGALEARKQLVRTTLEYLEQVEKDQGLDDSLRMVLSAAYFKIARIQGQTRLANLGDFPGALKSLRRAEALLDPVYRRKKSDPEVLFRYLFIQDGIAEMIQDKGEWRESVAMYQRLLPVAHRLGELRPNDANYSKQEAAVHSRLAFLYSSHDEKAYIEHARRQVTLMNALVDRFPQEAGLKQELAVGYSQLAFAVDSLEEADSFMKKSIALRLDLSRADPANITVRRGLMVTYGNYASILGVPWLANLGRYDEARQYAMKAVEIAREQVKADPQNQNARFDLASSLSRLGAIPTVSSTDALAYMNEAASILESLLKSNQSIRYIAQLGETLEYLGHRHRELGDVKAAEAAYRKSLDLVETWATSDSTALIQAMASEEAIAQLFAPQGRTAEALDFANRAVARARKSDTPSSNERMQGHIGRAYFALAAVRNAVGQPELSRQAASQASEHWSKLHSPRLLFYYAPLIKEAAIGPKLWTR